MNAAPYNSDLANDAQRGSHWHHRLVRPRALDLFCCAGGAGMGLRRAGYDVSGTGGPRVNAVRTDGKGGNSRKPKNLEEARAAMGIEWTDRKHLSQAIPPAYAEHLARQTLRELQRTNTERSNRRDPAPKTHE